ncbi:uncharacterized protein L201_005029 [Kwoniella dendrophila CBS 6074]|uniref:Uncharacterized protein n=1 Tax=Kwoniella dendrophila CBS 6074 TaxID=1295534 RepID=A0AAX4JY03_9TREE
MNDTLQLSLITFDDDTEDIDMEIDEEYSKCSTSAASSIVYLESTLQIFLNEYISPQRVLMDPRTLDNPIEDDFDLVNLSIAGDIISEFDMSLETHFDTIIEITESTAASSIHNKIFQGMQSKSSFTRTQPTRTSQSANPFNIAPMIRKPVQKPLSRNPNNPSLATGSNLIPLGQPRRSYGKTSYLPKSPQISITQTSSWAITSPPIPSPPSPLEFPPYRQSLLGMWQTPPLTNPNMMKIPHARPTAPLSSQVAGGISPSFGNETFQQQLSIPPFTRYPPASPYS